MNDLLTSALDAHGGLSRWREIEAFRLKVSIGGGLWRLKGLPDPPFVFTEPGFETCEIGPHEETGETWHRLLVRYPSSIPTHCAEQVLYFNAQGLLQRMDYSVDVVGDMVAAAASHYCFDHIPFGDIVIPTLRRAVSRTPKGAVLSGPTGVLLQMSDITLIPHAPKEKSNDQ